MHKFVLQKCSPNFEDLKRVLKGEKEPKKVYFVELAVDPEMMKFITENVIKEKWFPTADIFTKRPTEQRKFNLNEQKRDLELWKQYISFYYYMGYDYVPAEWPLSRLITVYTLNTRRGNDIAFLSRGKRTWAEESRGAITSWEDFEKFPWKEIRFNLENYDFEYYNKFLQENLPERMKIMVQSSLFEQVAVYILGYEGLSYLLYDQPDLVKTVLDSWGEVIYRLYESVISMKGVGGIFHGDDLGYKTGTIVNPDILRRFVFPWFKKYASLAHKHGKMYWYHCCGNVSKVMEDLIEEVKIDAFHSFQDVIIPVGKFTKKYGDRIAALGGIDMDKLGRMEEKELRKYVRDTLEECMPGRYALGSGNTIANYIPPRNYLTMLDEGLNW